jgi:sugar/nucleoside kinase (ribokinase family)
MAGNADENVILVVGALGLDRLLTVPRYPEADAKIRTTAYNEEGGGNAANTASAMGLLRDAAFIRDKNIKVKLLTKVGDDSVGQQLIKELETSNVDTSSPLFRIGPPGSTTAFTTIIVSESEHTRTCFHTPGTCGELTIEDAQSVDLDEVFRNVVHLHSDSRFTEFSLFLAKEAKKRGLSISCDTEKDRKTKALDELIQLTDLLFTNSYCLIDYLKRLDSELEAEKDRDPLPKPVVNFKDSQKDPKMLSVYARSLTPCVFFARWYPQPGKQVVVTQ